jgi:CHAT domain-containing protein/tetratricopeptide (TPR) repeat protein
MPEAPLKQFLLVAIMLVLPLTGRPAPDEVVTDERPAEFMIYQHPDTLLVLKLDVEEAEFSVRTFGPENALIKWSTVPGRRVGPIYQYIDAVDQARQLMIEISPGRPVKRSAIGLEILQFNAGDRNSATQAKAYRMLSLGCEASLNSDASTWASKAYSFRNAAALFANLGMEEMRLWAEYLAAHLVFHRLADPLTTLELVELVQRDASRAGFVETEFAARVLESDAVMQLAAGAGGQPARLYRQRAHEVLADVVTLAQRLGRTAEHSRALYQDGRVYELQGEPERALDRYRVALDIAAAADDTELLNQIRATSAEVYESLGRTSGAIAMLDDMADNLAVTEQENADLELARRLFEKGRLLNNSYRFAEAVTALSRALELQQANAEPWVWGPVGLELAWAYYAQGDADRALGMLEPALPVTPVRGNEAVLARAYGSLANIHRERGRFEPAARARDQQGTLLGERGGRAAFLIDVGLDAWSRDGPGSPRAQESLQGARQAATQEGDEVSANRASLHLCLLRLERSPAEACDTAVATASYQSLQTAGIPRWAADGALVYARTMRRSGQPGEARSAMDRLIDELHWYRRVLPGVLGAWYAENRDTLAREYLSLTRASPSRSARGATDGAALLLAMERVRMLEAPEHERAGSRLLEPSEEDALRGLLSRREAASGVDASRLASEVNRGLADARRVAGSAGETLSAADLEHLLAGLGRSEAVLSYYFAGGQTQALLARRNGVQAIDLPGSTDVQDRLQQMRTALSGPGTPDRLADLDALGRELLGPLDGALPEKVYLLPTGPLRAVPLDALRLRGRYFAEDHQLASLASLTSIARRSPAMPEGFRDHVFLAGNPQEQGDPFSLEIRTSPEIAAVTDQFIGPGLHIVQGIALRRDEFADDRFAGAALIHLALAGTLDLDFPERSRLLLAPEVAGQADNMSFLSPPDIRAFELAARLVVLSGTAVAGHGRSPVDSRLAFAADFFEAGCAAVIVSLRPAGEQLNADFFTPLYRQLKARPDIATALASAKRERIAADSGTNLLSWAGFQLFIR